MSKLIIHTAFVQGILQFMSTCIRVGWVVAIWVDETDCWHLLIVVTMHYELSSKTGKQSTRRRLPRAMTILLFSPSLENLNTNSKSKYQVGYVNNEVCSPTWAKKLNNYMFHHDKYVTAKLGAVQGESPGNPWDWKLTAQEQARHSAPCYRILVRNPHYR